MKQEKWFDRKFTFDTNQNIFPSIVERLSGTPVRLEEKLKEVPRETLMALMDNSWSIKENIGHLTDLEPLWQWRLSDIINGKPEMRPADLQNEKTDLANHNATSLAIVLSEFRKIRWKTIELLQSVTEESVFKAALHPRLKTPMRTMDLFLFVAEHDDHHLARITEIMTLCSNRNSEPLNATKQNNEYRVKFDFDINFTNGGSLQGKDFRLDLKTSTISDKELADYIASDLRLLMVKDTKIHNKEIIKETHKRT